MYNLYIYIYIELYILFKYIIDIIYYIQVSIDKALNNITKYIYLDILYLVK